MVRVRKNSIVDDYVALKSNLRVPYTNERQQVEVVRNSLLTSVRNFLQKIGTFLEKVFSFGKKDFFDARCVVASSVQPGDLVFSAFQYVFATIN